jgi:2-oxoglutarate dehydrogenase E2 component (dihydrolipoamide succinyltransferase)
MLSRSLFRATAAFAAPRRIPLQVTSVILQSRSQLRYASVVIKVPQMAESITEGTLKQFSKQVGDYVELDEEIATIETDKVSFNAWLIIPTSRLRTCAD